MVLHNAADSLADLLQIKHERELQSSLILQKQPSDKLMGGLSAARDSVADLSSVARDRRMKSSREPRPNGQRLGGEYDQPEIEEEQDDDAPIWEMDMIHNPWSGEEDMITNSPEPVINSSAGQRENNDIQHQHQQRHLSIADCERVFAVPEVFEDVMKTKGREGLLCSILSNCCDGTKENHKRGALMINDNNFDNLTTNQKMERMSLAVEMYMNIPAKQRQSFNPSLYKIRVINDGRACHPAMMGDNHQMYGYGSITTMSSSSRRRDNVHGKRRVHFSELKRVLKIRKFTEEEASDVWYQREDFAHFKAEMTLLIRDMEASKELAAMWLDSNDTSSRRSSESKLDDLEKLDCDEATRCSSESELDQLDKSRDNGNNNNNTHKSRAWWHNYDHSRRGLERYASHGQARQILASYKVATQKVFAEQRRQFLFECFLPCIPRNKARDADRIAEIYHAYTAWSSDLALAAGASDEDAVRTNFNDETRKTREYYLLKQVMRNGFKVHKHMPQFMLPKCITPKGFLDENETLLGRTASDMDKSQRRPELSIRERIIESAIKSIRGSSQTGEEAREEMSRLVGTDLTGPIAPALAPLFDDSGEKTKSAATSPQSPDRKGSMAAKAKNYPFQQ